MELSVAKMKVLVDGPLGRASAAVSSTVLPVLTLS